MSIETRLTKLEAKSCPEGPAIYFWAMNGCRPMTDLEIEQGIAALHAPASARVTSVQWLGN
ncbi:hypothetical protein [Bradyrhizobium erythrophlei]|uniref:Uncharacterized protein n=1 Tax=Bradyrhizobium erythrophlei TaxID=1437360 RepID=A0A1M7T6D6_9BRAD|nr:hypothetical protein [Bradyrhizobium erythrophlei]SHN66269.1 hypothetical protein SAMN05444170_0890 [Bradyrhizobium erythrophlei]